MTESAEQTVWTRGPSQMTALTYYLGVAIVAIIFGVASTYAFAADLTTVGYVPLAALAITLALAAYRFMTIRTTTYTLTSERLRVDSGVFSRTSEEIELYRIRDWAVDQPILLRVFGLGDLRIVSNDSSAPSLTLRGVPDAEDVRDKLRKHTEAARDRKRVRHLEVD